MRLCVPIEVKPQGGVYTFVANFLRWLTEHHVEFTRNIDDEYDVLFTNSWVVPVAAVKRARERLPDLRVVHRVDGSAVDYGSSAINDRVQARVNLLADRTIFQSEYSRLSTTSKFRVVTVDGPVIYNPVDVTQFSPEGPRLEFPPGPRVVSASWSVNPRKGTWQIDELARAQPNVQFVVCGRYDGLVPRANVHLLGHLDRDAMSEALRSCDVFLNLSENDPCPNVVLEALASGLPVLYKPSGGVPELVGDCGAPLIDLSQFRTALDSVMKERCALSERARQRTLERFAPTVIFPQYLDAIRTTSRTEEPSTWQRFRLARQGYPVLPASGPGDALRIAVRHSSAALRSLLRRPVRADVPSVAWITYDSFPQRKRRFEELDSFTRMRCGNIAAALNADGRTHHQLYRPERRYDVVIFQKMMDRRCQAEMQKIQAYGGKVIFDANVNYYEVWGDYFIPGTQPTLEQQRDAHAMTSGADWVVADSSYLESVIRKITSRVTWVPDNVDLAVYRQQRVHTGEGPVRLIWSGIAKKAAHLLDIREALARLTGAELILVTDDTPAVLADLQAVIPCSVVRFSDAMYARVLSTSDIIISPKRLVNAYELGHTEYKITLGMAVGLPAVASPQQSYVEAIAANGGGIIANTPEEWASALATLCANPELRAEMGARAHRTVVDRYSTTAISARYLDVILRVVNGVDAATSAARPA